MLRDVEGLGFPGSKARAIIIFQHARLQNTKKERSKVRTQAPRPQL